MTEKAEYEHSLRRAAELNSQTQQWVKSQEHELDYSKCKCIRCFMHYMDVNEARFKEERDAKWRAQEAAEEQYYNELAEVMETSLMPKAGRF